VEPHGLLTVAPFESSATSRRAYSAEAAVLGCEGRAPRLRHAAHRLRPTNTMEPAIPPRSSPTSPNPLGFEGQAAVASCEGG